MTIPARALPLGEALGLLLDPLGGDQHRLDYRVEANGSVTISTADALAAPPPSPRIKP